MFAKHGFSLYNTSMVKKTVKNTIQRYNLIEKGDHVIIGLSGGPDSMCLFLILLELQAKLDLEITAVHVNHMFRDVFAQRDQEYVEGFCAGSKVPCKVSVVDCTKMAKEQGLTTEEAGRNARYEAFYAAAKELIAQGVPSEKIKIAVAQNKNDQAETLLMRIMRGTGTQGLSGIEYSRAGEFGTTIIRPLLDVERDDIEEFCLDEEINPCFDHTNDEAIYTRNKIRLELIPYIAKNFNENIVDSLVRLSQNAKEDNEYLWAQAQIEYASLKKPKSETGTIINSERIVILNRTKLKKLSSAIRRRGILSAFFEIGLTQDIVSAHLDMIDQIIFSENASAKANLPNNYEMSVSYDEAFAYFKKSADTHVKTKTGRRDSKQLGDQKSGSGFIQTSGSKDEKASENEFEQTSESEFEINIKVTLASECEYLVFEAIKKPGNVRIVRFDYDALEKVYENAEESILIRGKKQGDYFTPRGMKKGKKKMQDYFVDRKIPKENREHYRLVAIGSEVLYLFAPNGVEHDETNEKYKVREDTKRVLLLEIR